jgi:hypothetical protein
MAKNNFFIVNVSRSHCDVSAGNVTNNLWFADFMLDLLVIHQAEFIIKYYSLNRTVITLKIFTG